MALRKRRPRHYLHLVWATKGREPLLTPELERQVHRCIESEARHLDCQVLALDGMADHVHPVVMLPTTVAVADLMKRVKGVSSALANDLNEHKILFRWQEGYVLLSVSYSHVDRVVAYVQNQNRHHASGKLIDILEQTQEETEEDEEQGPE